MPQTMPAHAYAFYMPEVFGRTVGSLFTITDPPAQEQTETPSEGEDSEE